jgi:hypothetical protein
MWQNNGKKGVIWELKVRNSHDTMSTNYPLVIYTMTKDIHRKSLFLLGAIAVILGSFLPWECSAGIEFQLGLASLSFDAIVMMAMILVAGSLIIGAIDFIQQWRSEIIVIFITVVLIYFLIDKVFIGGNGVIVIILCGIALWSVFRPARLTRQARQVATASTAALVLILAYYVVYVLYYQIAERDMIGGTTLVFGLPMAFVGSLLMLITQWVYERAVPGRSGPADVWTTNEE